MVSCCVAVLLHEACCCVVWSPPLQQPLPACAQLLKYCISPLAHPCAPSTAHRNLQVTDVKNPEADLAAMMAGH